MTVLTNRYYSEEDARGVVDAASLFTFDLGDDPVAWTEAEREAFHLAGQVLAARAAWQGCYAELNVRMVDHLDATAADRAEHYRLTSMAEQLDTAARAVSHAEAALRRHVGR